MTIGFYPNIRNLLLAFNALTFKTALKRGSLQWNKKTEDVCEDNHYDDNLDNEWGCLRRLNDDAYDCIESPILHSWWG